MTVGAKEAIGHFVRSKDPWGHKIRFLRYHWRCVLADGFAWDWEGAFIDFEVHMVRYTKSRKEH